MKANCDLVATTQADLPQISDWISKDSDHCSRVAAEAFLTGNGYLTFRYDDKSGPVFYFCSEREGEQVRIHIQFSYKVSKLRTAKALLTLLPIFTKLASKEFRGMVFDSTNPTLTSFFLRSGFQAVEGTNDFVFNFTE